MASPHLALLWERGEGRGKGEGKGEREGKGSTIDNMSNSALHNPDTQVYHTHMNAHTYTTYLFLEGEPNLAHWLDSVAVL